MIIYSYVGLASVDMPQLHQRAARRSHPYPSKNHEPEPATTLSGVLEGTDIFSGTETGAEMRRGFPDGAAWKYQMKWLFAAIWRKSAVSALLGFAARSEGAILQ